MTETPLDYPTILKQRVEKNDMTYGQAFLWLKSYGIKTAKAREMLREDNSQNEQALSQVAASQTKLELLMYYVMKIYNGKVTCHGAFSHEFAAYSKKTRLKKLEPYAEIEIEKRDQADTTLA